VQRFPGVPPVPTPGHPAGVWPNLTQYPTAPPTGFVPPSIQTVPGPATIAGSPAGPGSPAGVAGVQMAPVAGVAPPAVAGGPHPLPPFPAFPLPQGFPNPFGTGPVALGGAPQGPAGPMALGGAPPATAGSPVQTVMGPQGYFPGIGWVGGGGPGSAGTAPPAAFPGGAPPAAFPAPPFPAGALPAAFYPPQAGAPPGAPPAGNPAPVAAAGLTAAHEPASTRPGPFWLHLAWQLLQTSSVRDALGDLFDSLVRGPDRLETVQAAAGALTSSELQSAFQQVTNGQLDQSAFIRLFADRLKESVARRA
jgi:hypothetical protein